MKPFDYWLISRPSNLLQTFFCCGYLILLSNLSLFGQVTIDVHIEEGQAATTCSDQLSAPDPLWAVNVQGKGWHTYGKNACFTTLPHNQFTASVDCVGDLGGGEIQICFRAFENDAGFSNCNIVPSCDASFCKFFVLPLEGQDSSYTLALPEGMASSGFVNFTIAVNGSQNNATNDHICHAINLGTLSEGISLGNAKLGSYNNFCATAIKEANPKGIGGSFTNNVGVWFTFTTGDSTNELIILEAISDPEKTGDFVNLQLAVYQSDTDACEGELSYIADHHDPLDNDEYLILECLEPNQQYYILVDAVYDERELPALPSLNGYFAMHLRTADVTGTNDQICDAIPLPLEAGGTAIYKDFFNNCATNINDPKVANYPSLKPVWFQFNPPVARRVAIEAISNLPFPKGIDLIEPQLSVYESEDNTCAGVLTEIARKYQFNNGIASLTLDCLDPDKTYWLMVDGSVRNATGVFDIRITDLGYPELTLLDTTICAGTELVLGDKTYAEAGTYLDTILLENACLEIIQTNLVIADSLTVAINTKKIAGGLAVPDGIIELAIKGGSGNYTASWPNGRKSILQENLIGGTEYCVTIADIIGCVLDTCFIMPYIIPIDAEIKNDTLNCFGDTNGQLELIISNGQPPYIYSVINEANKAVEKGTLTSKTGNILVDNLAAGQYTFLINTEHTASEIIAKVLVPPVIEVSIIEQVNASCYNSCDASIDLNIAGGVGDFTFTWADGTSRGQNPRALCADHYQLTVTDGNKCIQTFKFDIEEPEKFVAKAVQTQAVQCFGEANGKATVSTNGNPIAYNWDNQPAAVASSIDNLKAGIHSVLVTNEDNCTDTAYIEISQPDMPIAASIDVLSTINCFGEATGLLQGIATGGNGNYQYLWDNTISTPLNDNLSAGQYQLTVTDQLGCTDRTTFLLTQPDQLAAFVSTQDVTCPGGLKSGLIAIENTTGGVAPYVYNLNESFFSDAAYFDRLAADEYEVFVQDVNGCEISQNVRINNPPTLEVTLGGNQAIKLGEFFELEAITNRPVSYQWKVPDSTNCSDCSSLRFQPISTATYSVTVTDIESECIATDAVVVNINKERDVFVPNAFSPNGDGQNDFLMVYGSYAIQEIKAFKVFDRHGALVYQANNFAPNDPNISWKGDFNGQRLPSAVFIYWAEVAFIDGYSEVFKGDIALMR